ncbi:hypothetical protein J6590_046554 [Homalodisca vitripennis]|nr:hypothetical protein J6590_046547 [Homalodisca vitripennis]KAG8326280.1 hypothetical protein J6590_046549 [Homalodisca vitripennis]KAG8326283.1 hypothetical protein J6590_046552 [Homalodisca vitripennis]KAG8326285.1 hypothetical protein J6590_046554 [Homalodisca vitripennis]
MAQSCLNMNLPASTRWEALEGPGKDIRPDPIMFCATPSVNRVPSNRSVAGPRPQ